MKHIHYLLIFALIVFVSCAGKEKTKLSDESQTTAGLAPEIEFSESTFDFGEINQGEVVVHKFLYKNKGNANLIITKVDASCGCTAMNFNDTPLPPGKESFIEVEFNTRGKKGSQYKTVTVYSNAKQKRTVLSIAARIK
ncbi:MAG: hypothetical protein CSA05_01180 [Bacteroidia bacterium]|nr:MAG: hypothetical protein CSA05_01180 [Bacteroidia bacterium]